MTKKIWSFLAVSGLVFGLAASLSAQTLRLNASIPFEFVAGLSTLPAGEYQLDSLSTPGVVRVWSDDSHTASLVMSRPVVEPLDKRIGEPKLIFHRYGNQYFLAQIWSGYGSAGRVIPVSKEERALSETAASRGPETVVVLARL
jgi:hypothetical protein